jgi:hypothetical protein
MKLKTLATAMALAGAALSANAVTLGNIGDLPTDTSPVLNLNLNTTLLPGPPDSTITYDFFFSGVDAFIDIVFRRESGDTAMINASRLYVCGADCNTKTLIADPLAGTLGPLPIVNGPAGFSTGAVASGLYLFEFDGYSLGTGTNVAIALTVSPVPEPGTYALMLAGLGVVGFLASRRRPQRDLTPAAA